MISASFFIAAVSLALLSLFSVISVELELETRSYHQPRYVHTPRYNRYYKRDRILDLDKRGFVLPPIVDDFVNDAKNVFKKGGPEIAKPATDFIVNTVGGDDKKLQRRSYYNQPHYGYRPRYNRYYRWGLASLTKIAPVSTFTSRYVPRVPTSAFTSGYVPRVPASAFTSGYAPRVPRGSIDYMPDTRFDNGNRLSTKLPELSNAEPSSTSIYNNIQKTRRPVFDNTWEVKSPKIDVSRDRRLGASTDGKGEQSKT